MARNSGSVSFRLRTPCAVAALVLFACSTCLGAGGTGPQQNPSPPKDSEKAIPLETGKVITSELPAGSKHTYSFEMGQGRYNSVQVECPNLSATTSVSNSDGDVIDRSFGNARWTREMVEVAAEKTGTYRLEVGFKVAQDGGKTCTVRLGNERPASDKDFQLQQARTQIAQAATMTSREKGDEAIKKLEKALEIRERLLGPEDPSLALPLGLIGSVYLHKPDYPKAEVFYDRALKLEEKTGHESSQLYTFLNNTSIIYIETDRYEAAEQCLLRAVAVAEKVYGPGRPAAVNAAVNLANLYDDKGEYIKAQAMYEKAWADGSKALGPDYPGLAVIVANLSGVYSERGDYAGAARLGQQAIEIADKPGRKEDQRLALALVALGDAYRFQNDLDRAEPLYQRSLKIYEQVAGADDPLVADNLEYLADIYRQRHVFAKAEDFYQKSLTIRRTTLGEGSSGVAKSLDSLGSLYLMQADYTRAEPLFRQALTIREKVFGAEHPQVAETLTSLAALEMATGHAVDAQSNLARAIAITEHNADLNLVAGSERQKLAYLELSSSQLDQAITLSADLASDQEAARNLAVTTVLQRKGRVLDALADSLHALRQRLDPEGNKLLDQFDEVTSHLARLALSTSEKSNGDEQQKRIAALKEQREKLEAEISLRSAEFRGVTRTVTLDAIRAALPARTALVEFVDYRKFLPASLIEKNPGAQRRYIAYVIRPSGPVQWKELGDAAELDRAIDGYRQALRDPGRNDATRLARSLDERLLAPLRPLAGDATHLLIAPDGQLSLMPFEALVDAQNHYAVENYSITYLSTGRDVLRMQESSPSKSDALILADPLFGEPGTTLVAAAHLPNSRDRRRSITTASDLSGVYFAPLVGTAQEARSIQSLFPGAKVLTGAGASIAALKQAEAPRILHIATHGFFLEDHPRAAAAAIGKADSARGLEATLDVNNPLLRSGLAFAGANLSRTGKDNGILTALEASTLNLWGTKLVTLSACDTGIGEIKDREGVYGLRRSFFLAGAETLVMSLWPVSDRVTREMMVAYYSGLKQGLGRGEALRQAELAMLKRKDRQHPFYWASFIQSGEWANLDGKR